MEHVFEKPYEFEGKTYDSLEFDVESLKGTDIAAVKKQFTAAGNFAPVPGTDSEFCAMILARVTKQPLEFFSYLPAKDYIAITQKVSNFLLA